MIMKYNILSIITILKYALEVAITKKNKSKLVSCLLIVEKYNNKFLMKNYKICLYGFISFPEVNAITSKMFEYRWDSNYNNDSTKLQKS